MTICSCGFNPNTGKSYDEDLYMETIDKYKSDSLRHNFPKMVSAMIREMEERNDDGGGNDILGEFYELEFGRKSKGQFFTPFPVSKFMASIAQVEHDTALEQSDKKLLRILDPCCGSGRMLTASAKVSGHHHHFYGIDIDLTCVKMTVLNLFFNGIFKAEVMWANALDPNDFKGSYTTSLFPLGIFRITEKEKSPLWNINQDMLKRDMPDFDNAPNLIQKIHKEHGGSQLVLL